MHTQVRSLVVLAALSLAGCVNYGSLEMAHSSHPFAGEPFGDRTEEDSFNRANACIGHDNSSGWYAESCLGYKIGDGGFYGPRLTFDGRVGRRFRFDH